MSRNLLVLLANLSIAILLTTMTIAINAQSAKIVQIDVKVVAGKPTGTERGMIRGKPGMLWDIRPFEQPDIAICLSENNSAYKCVRGDCGDGYFCTFIGVPVSSNNFKIIVADVDLFEHDLIGEGTCGIDQTCNIGQAQVKITNVPCADKEIRVNYDKESTGQYNFPAQSFKKYLASYHLYVLENKICDTTNSKCTQALVFSTMLGQLQYIAPANNNTLPVTNCMVADADVPGPFGDDPIRVSVNSNNYSITNYTRKDHSLYPGKVTRTLIKKNSAIYVLTEGEGFGIFPDVSMLAASKIWNSVDKKLAEAVKRNLAGK